MTRLFLLALTIGTLYSIALTSCVQQEPQEGSKLNTKDAIELNAITTLRDSNSTVQIVATVWENDAVVSRDTIDSLNSKTLKPIYVSVLQIDSLTKKNK